ncbi:hypothetical protein GN244_ATG03966 [Phytophthora infestans]|uniref:Uncharacterized protein n=1 Tax=Phytophthora infestans TaxID=4787 RepID=A0A833WJE3_PHYIN|nr:hypothetical protein GN244_ATG03966 [Phytophthora infestans]KAF4146789.1 hypothetical protein GN958_ATG04043 [Phytophthora infestans]
MNDPQEFNMNHTMVQTGAIVSVFECQFDRMWKVASQKTTKRGKRARVADSEESEPGKKRKAEKRTCFPTTLSFLEMLGL